MKLTLLKELALTDFKLRYKNSVLGYLWSLLKPLAIFGSLYLVFSLFIRFDVEFYQLFLLLGILLWNYFTEATINGMHVLVEKSTLLTKINVNKATIVLASNVTTLLTLALNLLIFFSFLIIFNPHFSWSFFMLPVIVVELFLVGLGISYMLSVLYVKLRDLTSIWDIVIQIGFWVTPIIYPLSFIPERYHFWFNFNPIFRIIDEARDAFIHGSFPALWPGLITFGYSVFFVLIGYLVYRWKAPTVNEEL